MRVTRTASSSGESFTSSSSSSTFGLSVFSGALLSLAASSLLSDAIALFRPV